VKPFNFGMHKADHHEHQQHEASVAIVYAVQLVWFWSCVTAWLRKVGSHWLCVDIKFLEVDLDFFVSLELKESLYRYYRLRLKGFFGIGRNTVWNYGNMTEQSQATLTYNCGEEVGWRLLSKMQCIWNWPLCWCKGPCLTVL